MGRKKSYLNEVLLRKREIMVGNRQFVPESYLHLGWYWGLISDDQLAMGKRYGYIRGRTLASQGRVTRWSHLSQLYPGRSPQCSDQERIALEAAWREIIGSMDTRTVGFMDWLTLEPINYGLTRGEVESRIRASGYWRDVIPNE